MAGHNNFINEWVTVNFNDLLSRITSGQDSTPYTSIDRHLVRIKFKTTASDANRPTSLKIALSALKNWHLEWSNEHLNTRPLTKNTPRYLHWMHVKFSTYLYSCVPTLHCKLPHAKHVKCNAFSSVYCGWLCKELILYSRCSKWCLFAFTHARSRALHWSTALSMMFCGMLPWHYNSDVENASFMSFHFRAK